MWKSYLPAKAASAAPQLFLEGEADQEDGYKRLEPLLASALGEVSAQGLHIFSVCYGVTCSQRNKDVLLLNKTP